MPQFVISLRDVTMFARIGVFEQERTVGNEFTLNVSVTLDAAGFEEENLGGSVSYADIYDVAKEIMARPHLLLETVALEIARALQDRFPAITQGCIEIVKKRPPIKGFDGQAGVEYVF